MGPKGCLEGFMGILPKVLVGSLDNVNSMSCGIVIET